MKRPYVCVSSPEPGPSYTLVSTPASDSPDTPRKKKLKKFLFQEVLKNKKKTKKLRILNQSLRRSRRKIVSLKEIVRDLKKKNFLDHEKCMLLENMTDVNKELLKRKLGRKQKYSPQLRKFAISLNFFFSKSI